MNTLAAAPDVSLYEGRLVHRRVDPEPRTFTRRHLVVAFDADGLPVDGASIVPGLAPLGRLLRDDYFDTGDRSLGDAVRQLVHDRTGTRPGGVRVLTQPRMAGHLFNPLTVYFCADASTGVTSHLVLEVTNTPWKERTWYVVAIDAARPHGPWEFAKTMHVSPFLPMDLTYRLRVADHGDRITVSLDDLDGDRAVFHAGMALRRIAPTRGAHLLALVRHAAQTWRATIAIHRHALARWLQGVTVHPHPEPRPVPIASGGPRT